MAGNQEVIHAQQSLPQTLEQEAATSVLGMLKKYGSSIKGALPKALDKDRFAWLVVNSIRQNPRLAECTPASFLNSVMLASNMGLEIRRNSAYLVPYGKECQLLIDYRGKLDLARRAGNKAISVELVREYDRFEYRRTSQGTHLLHEPLLLSQSSGRLSPVGDTGEVVLAYAMADVGGEERQIEVMTVSQIEGIRRRAKTGCGVPFQHYGKSMPALSLADIRKLDPATMAFKDPYRVPWVTDYDQQARKTVIHRLCNYLRQSTELLMSQEVDDAVDTGTRMPIAEQLEEMISAIDPADNRPMVESPEGTEEAKAAQLAVVKQKTNLPTYASWDEIANDQVAPELGLRIIVGKKTYSRQDTSQTWTAEK